MVRDVHKQVSFRKLFKPILCGHGRDNLRVNRKIAPQVYRSSPNFSRRGRHISRKDDNPPHYRFLVKNTQKPIGPPGSDEWDEEEKIDELPHGIDADTFLVRKEYENLVRWIVSGVGEEIELVSTGPCESISAVYTWM